MLVSGWCEKPTLTHARAQLDRPCPGGSHGTNVREERRKRKVQDIIEKEKNRKGRKYTANFFLANISCCHELPSFISLSLFLSFFLSFFLSLSLHSPCVRPLIATSLYDSQVAAANPAPANLQSPSSPPPRAAPLPQVERTSRNFVSLLEKQRHLDQEGSQPFMPRGGKRWERGWEGMCECLSKKRWQGCECVCV